MSAPEPDQIPPPPRLTWPGGTQPSGLWNTIVGAMFTALFLWEIAGPWIEMILDDVRESVYCADPTDTCGKGDDP